MAHWRALRGDLAAQRNTIGLVGAYRAHCCALRISGWRPTDVGGASWRRSHTLLAQVMVVLGAGRTPCWRRCDFPQGTCAANRASTRSGGAGGRGFSTPAPGRGYTCARKPRDLRQRYVLRSGGVFCELGRATLRADARVRHRRTGAVKAPAAPFPHYYPIQLSNPKFTAHPMCHSTAFCGTLARAANFGLAEGWQRVGGGISPSQRRGPSSGRSRGQSPRYRCWSARLGRLRGRVLRRRRRAWRLRRRRAGRASGA